MRTLYQFPLSHFCEKARWCLDHKQLDYVARNLPAGLHAPYVKLRAGGHTLPMLHDGKTWLNDSTQIALYLEGLYPERPLLSRDGRIRNQQLRIDSESQQLGEQVRYFALHAVLDDPKISTQLMGGKLPKPVARLALPMLRKAARYHYRIHDYRVSVAERKLDELFNRFERDLIANGGRYLAGQYLSLADIAVASMIAPLLMLPGTPWELGADQTVPEAMQYKADEIKDRPLGQYIARLYDYERQARVDWHGQ